MALNDQNHNIVGEEIQLAATILALKNQLRSLITRFNENNVYIEASDAELAVTPSLGHLTQSKMGNGIAAFQAIVDILNANSEAHTIALELMKG